MLEELYQDLIISSADDERFRGVLGEGASCQRLKNPLCGDEIELWVRFAGGAAEQCAFQGEGCLISRAAAAMMAERAQGRSLAELEELVADYESMIKGSASEDALARLGDLAAFSGVRRFPARARCALLAFEALRRLLEQQRAST